MGYIFHEHITLVYRIFIGISSTFLPAALCAAYSAGISVTRGDLEVFCPARAYCIDLGKIRRGSVDSSTSNFTPNRCRGGGVGP